MKKKIFFKLSKFLKKISEYHYFWILFVFLIALLLVLIFLSNKTQFLKNNNSNRNILKSKKITINVGLRWLNQAQFAGMYVAKDKGFYNAAGLDVHLHPYANNEDLVVNLENGKYDFIVADPVEILKGINNGAQIKAIAVIYQESPLGLISLKKENITSVADLVGKKLENKGGSEVTDILYDNLLNKFSIPKKDVKFVDSDFSSTELEDLLNGQADIVNIYTTDELYSFIKKGIAYNLIEPNKYESSFYGDTIATNNIIIKNNPQIVQAFVSATIKGWEYALKHRTEAIAITTRYASGSYQDVQYERFILNNSAPLIRANINQKIGSMNYISWRRFYENLQGSELLKLNFNIFNAYTNQFLK